jgi:MYND finger
LYVAVSVCDLIAFTQGFSLAGNDHCAAVQNKFCCHGCGAIRPKMQKCVQCAHAWYCSKECQKADWSAHEAFCKTMCNEMAAKHHPERCLSQTFFREHLQVRHAECPTITCAASHCCPVTPQRSEQIITRPSHIISGQNPSCALCRVSPRLAVQLGRPPHLLRFWLGIATRTISSHKALTAVVSAVWLINYLWHNTAAAVPARCAARSSARLQTSARGPVSQTA